MVRTITGLYLIALGAGLITWMAGPLYGQVPAAVWMTALCGQIAIGGALIALPWDNR